MNNDRVHQIYYLINDVQNSGKSNFTFNELYNTLRENVEDDIIV